MKNILKNLFLAIIIWFGLFSGNYILFNIEIYPPLYLSLIGYLIYLFRTNIPSYVILFYMIGLFYVCLFIISHLYNGFLIEIFLIEMKYILKAFFIPLGVSLLLLYLFKQKKLNKCEISLLIFYVILLQALLVVFQLSNDAFREWFFSNLNLADEWKYLVEIGHFRTVGLSGLSIYDTSLAYSLLFGLTIYMYIENKYIYNILWILTWFLFFILILLSGRSGLILFMILTIFIIFIKPKKIISLNMIVVFCILLLILLNYIKKEKILFFLNFAFEFFYNENGNFETASTNDLLKNHLFFPYNVNPIFGDSIWAFKPISDSLNYMYTTDSGYILSYISLGVSGVIMSIFMTYIVFKGYEISYFNHFGKLYLKMIFMIIIFALIVGVIFKGPLFFSDKFMPTLIFVFMIQHYLKRGSKN